MVLRVEEAAALLAPETWPDYASELGRFTPLRPGGLAGQTFEIEVVAGAATRHPLITRGYVTATGLRLEGNLTEANGGGLYAEGVLVVTDSAFARLDCVPEFSTTLRRALAAETWQARQAALIPAYLTASKYKRLPRYACQLF